MRLHHLTNKAPGVLDKRKVVSLFHDAFSARVCAFPGAGGNGLLGFCVVAFGVEDGCVGAHFWCLWVCCVVLCFVMFCCVALCWAFWIDIRVVEKWERNGLIRQGRVLFWGAEGVWEVVKVLIKAFCSVLWFPRKRKARGILCWLTSAFVSKLSMS